MGGSSHDHPGNDISTMQQCCAPPSFSGVYRLNMATSGGKFNGGVICIQDEKQDFTCLRRS
eukprot:scaffold448302_cov13-Prasinocladus_malaysianus.AAC.1